MKRSSFLLLVALAGCKGGSDCSKILSAKALNDASSKPLRVNDKDTRSSPRSCTLSLGNWGGIADVEVSVLPGAPEKIDAREGLKGEVHEAIPGVGDEAYLLRRAVVSYVRVKQGPYTITVMASGDRISPDKLKALVQSKDFHPEVVDSFDRL